MIRLNSWRSIGPFGYLASVYMIKPAYSYMLRWNVWLHKPLVHQRCILHIYLGGAPRVAKLQLCVVLLESKNGLRLRRKFVCQQILVTINRRSIECICWALLAPMCIGSINVTPTIFSLNLKYGFFYPLLSHSFQTLSQGPCQSAIGNSVSSDFRSRLTCVVFTSK